MNQSFFLAPASFRVGLTSVCQGLVHAFDREGLRTTFFKPIAQLYEGDTGPERSTHLIRQFTTLDPPEPISLEHAEDLVNRGRLNDLLSEVVELYHQAAHDADVVIIEGLHTDIRDEHAVMLNREIASTLDSNLIIVSGARGDHCKELNDQIQQAANYYRETLHDKVLGVIVNFINAPRDEHGRIRPDLQITQTGEAWSVQDFRERCPVFQSNNLRMIGGIPWEADLVAPRVLDISSGLQAEIINRGDIETRRVKRVFVCARSVDHITHVFQAQALLLIPVDRVDLFIAACMAAQNGVQLAGIVLTSGTGLDGPVRDLCKNALATGLPVIAVSMDTYTTATMIPRMNLEVPIDDQERMNGVMEHMASNLDVSWLKEQLQIHREPRFSPAAFKYLLIEKSRAVSRRIVLPEGDEPRTIRAAASCQAQGIAQCVLLGRPATIREVAESNGIALPEDLELVDPRPLRAQVIDSLLELRKHRGLTRVMAASQLEDNVVLGTMMLKMGMVHGLVSGAVHTTANTVRPALQLIKTRPGTKIVSSVFFMCLPEQVVLYGDCAINPDPNAQELADIALQSADTAAAFGLPVRVAMISYSTGESGSGEDVDKVREATRLARERRPDLVIDGPLQYDAAAIESVARSKAPNSPVAGKATVFIFPDLNTGNTTYKAVQRSAHVVSIGPMLQGLNAPVNDLSRGALVEDIVYTIAITAIQAGA